MDDLSFLDFEQFDSQEVANNAILRVQLPDGQVSHVTDRICTYKLLDDCPLLYHAFEYGYQSRPQASIEAPSTSAAISLLRYCYTGNYLPVNVEDAPIMFLPHAETYKMAEDFDIPELQLIAHGNFSCQINFACSLPTPPFDLLETIRFVYAYFSSHQSRQQQDLLSTLLNYCISMFEYHKLGMSVEFLQVVREIPEFRQDLCRTNMERNFEDDCAFDIIRLSLDTLQPYAGRRPDTLASRDLPEAMLYDRPETLRPVAFPSGVRFVNVKEYVKTEDDTDDESTMQRPAQSNAFASSSSTLVYRPKAPQPEAATDFETDMSSDEEGYAIIRHPKEELMSSPELVPCTPIDVLAATGSNYPSDDEWTTVDMEL